MSVELAETWQSIAVEASVNPEEGAMSVLSLLQQSWSGTSMPWALCPQDISHVSKMIISSHCAQRRRQMPLLLGWTGRAAFCGCLRTRVGSETQMRRPSVSSQR